MSHILVTGGTGTLGGALVSKLSQNSFNRIVVFSRDENKQKALGKRFPNVDFVVGDICCQEDIRDITYGKFDFDHIYHCAAMKHIEVCEKHVHKCIQTNYQGVKNVYDILGRNVRRFALFTTDKAVAPVNAYGHSKALAEKYLDRFDNVQIFRWGNVLGSTGSVLPYLCHCAMTGEVFNITDPTMTRFWIHIDDAIKFVLDNKTYTGKRAIYPPMVSASLDVLISTVEFCLGKKIKRKTIEKRPGEKQHECMVADYHKPRFYSFEKTLNTTQMEGIIRPWLRNWRKQNTK